MLFRSDSAELAQVELVGSEFNPRAKAETAAAAEGEKPKAKGVGGRLRAAAERLRGGKKEGASEETKAPKKGAGKGAAAWKGKKKDADE